MDQLETKTIVFFDGHCNLCNFAVDFIIRFNSKRNLYFAPLTGSSANRLLANTDMNSIVLYDAGTTYSKSMAAFKIAADLDWPIKWIGFFRFMPRAVADGLYDLVAKLRYKLFGKRESCRLASPEEKIRFLN